MELRLLSKEIDKHLDKEVVLSGWIKKNRDQKNFGFIEFNDGTTFKGIQVVYEDSLPNFSEIAALNVYSSIKVKGTLVKSVGKGQDYEIKASEITIYDACDEKYPLQNKRHSVEFLRTIAHLRPRTNTFNAVFRVRSLLSYAIHKFFQERGYVYVQTPL